MTFPKKGLPNGLSHLLLAALVCLTLLCAGFAARAVFADESRQAHAFVAEGQRALLRNDKATAALAFERARWLAPRAEAVRSAVSAIGVQDAEPLLPRALRLVTSQEWSLLATACGWVSGIGIVFVVLRSRSRSARWVALAAGGAFVLGMAGVVESSASMPAIVVGADAPLLVAPYSTATVERALPVGTMVIVGSPYDDFVHVEDRDGAEGWVKRASVECVASSKG